MFLSRKSPSSLTRSKAFFRFNGAGMFLSRKLNRSRFRTSRSGSFNGAGMFLSRKYHQGRRLHLLHDASMGPGCFYPGNINYGSGVVTIARLQWGRDVSIPEMLPCHTLAARTACFNGAGMFLSRKYVRVRQTPEGLCPLQWGRDVSIPEITSVTVNGHALSSLQWGRDVSIYLGNPDGRAVPRAAALASMGPGCFYPGNKKDYEPAAEQDYASMGPGCFYPGNAVGGPQGAGVLTASMGPGCFYPGNGVTLGTTSGDQ